MALKIHNTLTKKLEEFQPINPSNVKMYVCGPTVYHLLHVGNFRGPVFYNFVRNWLEYLGYKVTYALNFTDVDDKIINRANELKEDPTQLAARYIEEYKKDFSLLGLKPHHYNPKVTESIPEIVSIIEDLIKKNKAYVVDGDVWYSIESFTEYGKLSGRKTDELIAGARVQIEEKKKNPLDFALWKAAKPGEPSWDSPWGKGRPGWHIECSAMVNKIFGPQIDIHGGGTDLIFPHHENEIAQSEGCSEKLFSKYWIHVGMLNLGGVKMSKSLGNIVSLREFLSLNHPEIYKWMILSVHYRTQAEFSEETKMRATKNLARIYSALAMAENLIEKNKSEPLSSPAEDPKIKEAWKKIEDAINQDFGTPDAMSVIFELIRDFNSKYKYGMKLNPNQVVYAQLFINLIKSFGEKLSLFQEKPKEFLTQLDDVLLKQMSLDRNEINKLVQERTLAREQKNFPRSDELRDQLANMKIQVMDTKEGTLWEVNKSAE